MKSVYWIVNYNEIDLYFNETELKSDCLSETDLISKIGYVMSQGYNARLNKIIEVDMSRMQMKELKVSIVNGRLKLDDVKERGQFD